MAKYRTGFVSNSSSSSFTCDICGETASGMDMVLSDADMFSCENGHICCNSHQIETPEPSLEEKRKSLVAKIQRTTYYTDVQRAAECLAMADYSEDEVCEAYDDLMTDDGHSANECPVCMFQKIDQSLAFQYLLKKYSITIPDLLVELKTKYPSFAEFRTDILGK